MPQNNNNVLTVRLDKDCLKKLDKLIEFEKAEARRIGFKAGGKKAIIEDAIRELYYKKINKTMDADIVGRISMTVDDKVNTSMHDISKKIDQILYLTVKNDYGNKLLYRSPGILPPPPMMDDAIEIIVEEESGWNNALEEYMMSNLKDIIGKDD